MKPQILRHAPALRTALIFPALGFAIYWFVREVGASYPIGDWIFWVYARVWSWCGLFALACASSGNLVLSAVGGRTLPLRERALLSLACGVLVFFGAMFVGGLFGMYGPAFAIAMPLVLVAAGARDLFRTGRRAARRLVAARRRGVAARPWWFYPVLAYGGLGVGMVYFAILSPQNIAFDSHFYHLGLAQQYAVQGGVGPSVEGWMPAAIPHLASLLYTWAFLLPGADMFERIVGAAHVEMVVFLWTLASIPLLVRRLLPRSIAPRPAWIGVSWVALFLFPGIYVYDSSLTVAADHVSAFWSVPIFLLLSRAIRTLRTDFEDGRRLRRDFGLLAAMLGGALLTKYQAMYLLAFPVLAVLGSIGWHLVGIARRDRARLRRAATASFVALGVATGVGLAITAPHWLKNWVWFGDPMFPYLHRTFSSPRWVADVGPLFEGWSETQTDNWRPEGTTRERLHETMRALVYFSFEPHDWPKFHGKVPVFGSLFTLSLLVLPFVRGAKRAWVLVLATYLGVFVWYWTMHQDRYLQTLVPWMAAVVAVTIILAWRTHWSVRPFVCGWVAMQAIWGGDAYFIPSHAMTGASPAKTTSELLAAGYAKKYEERFAVSGALFGIGRDPALPAEATVLLHEHNPRLGIWRPVVMDIAGWVYGMRYDRFETPAALDAKLAEYGVTHVLTRHQTSRGFDSLGADLQFFAYVELDASLVKRFGEWALYARPDAPPSRPSNGVVAYLGCGALYGPGLHRLESLSVRQKQVAVRPPRLAAEVPASKDPLEIEQLLARADYAVTDANCKLPVPAPALRPFVKVGMRDKEQLFARKP